MMMNAIRGRISTNLVEMVHRTDSPFIAQVTSFPLLAKFQMPQVEVYDRSKDPLDHLESFKTLMHLQGVPDEIMCKAFLTTLKGPTKVLFSKLTSNTISIFKTLNGHFVTHFIVGQRHRRSFVAILNIKQWEGESLRSYVTHFNKESLLTKMMTKSFSLLSPVGCNRGSFSSPSTRTTQRQWPRCYTRP